MIVKVKEPQPQEYNLLHEGQILFTYLHLAASLEMTEALIKSGITGIAYETVQSADNSLPLLIPMSEIAGKVSVQAGACYLQCNNGGSGILLGGVPGIQAGKVAVIGGGTVGTKAAMIALGMGADVCILDVNIARLRYLSDVLKGKFSTLYASQDNIEQSVAEADLLIGAVLIPGEKAKKLVTREMIARMRKGSVAVDVAIDQGGCFETSRPTSLDDPVFVIDGVIHYCVTNMPATVSRTSTFALTNVTFPYVQKLADMGLERALESDAALRKGLNLYQGRLVIQCVAGSLGLACSPVSAF